MPIEGKCSSETSLQGSDNHIEGSSIERYSQVA
jgi:hypothetical protein